VSPALTRPRTGVKREASAQPLPSSPEKRSRREESAPPPAKKSRLAALSAAKAARSAKT
jgi:hypothetical protein